MSISCARKRVLHRTRSTHIVDPNPEREMPILSPEHRPNLLRADCTECFGLCCVALSFERSADFALTKSAGDPCVNLTSDFACGIHERLRPSGFKGCTVFDCFGAGQKVAQTSYSGVSWRDNPASRQEMFAVFPVMRDLHEMLWYLTEAAELPLPPALSREVSAACHSVAELTELAPAELLRVDAAAQREPIVTLLAQVSEHIRSRMAVPWKRSKKTRDVAPRADLMARAFSGDSLRGANLRGAYLIAADLTDADLTLTDLIGADLRDARLHGANLSESLFLTQQQVNSALGDALTSLPSSLERPAHWV